MDTIFFPDTEERIGKKAAAMQYFSDRGLFSKQLIVLEPANTFAKNEKMILDSRLTEDTPYTIRYSQGNDLSLPRQFVTGITAVLENIKMHRKPNWTIIIHPYLNAKRSFEVLIDTTSFTLEHVPGLWESDNTSAPDAIMTENKKYHVWRYQKERTAKYQNPTESGTMVSAPCERETLEQWITKITAVAKTIRSDFSAALPINIHFIEDETGKWQFLNIRSTQIQNNKINFATKTFEITNLADLQNWDESTPIVLKISSVRGAESELFVLAKALPKDQDIFIEFGALSHPAMILREFGCRLLPSYLLAPKEKGVDYEYYETK